MVYVAAAFVDVAGRVSGTGAGSVTSYLLSGKANTYNAFPDSG